MAIIHGPAADLRRCRIGARAVTNRNCGMSIEPVNSANAHSARSVDPAMPGSSASHIVRRTRRRNDVEDPEAPVSRNRWRGLASARTSGGPALCFRQPLVDLVPAIWMQAPTGHLFKYPNKLTGEQRIIRRCLPKLLASPIDRRSAAGLPATFGEIVPLLCDGRKYHLFHYMNKLIEPPCNGGSGLQASISERSSTTSRAPAKSSSLK